MNTQIDDDQFMNYWYGWFAGLTDGEGYFSIKHGNGNSPCANYKCRFVIALREDDWAVLEEIRAMLGIGILRGKSVSPGNLPNTRPQIRYRVSAIADCAKLVDIFERFPLRAKKQRDFSVWRCAVVELQKPVSDRNADLLEYYFRRIKQVRQYKVSQEIPKPIIVDTQLIIDF